VWDVERREDRGIGTSELAANLIVVATAAITAGLLLLYRPLASSSSWRATITPLASIMGSGFLVCAPLLYTNVGNAAVAAMAVLLALAYAVGAVIRFNIRFGEPLLENDGAAANSQRAEHRMHSGHHHAGRRIRVTAAAEFIEKISHVALTMAYCVSVSYYLQLLSSFALQPFGMDPTWSAKVLTTAVLVGIGGLGAMRGLQGIERMERVVVGVNLGLVAALIAGLVYHNAVAASAGAWHLQPLPPPADRVHAARLLMGMLIVVQGFETSRFLGLEHSAEQRIRTMRWAQLISAAIYLAFIGLMALVVSQSGSLAENVGITAIVHLSGGIAPVLPALLTITAIGSQFSAAAADDAGCSGLLESFFRRLFAARWDYVFVSIAAVILTWLTNIYEIISFASRAFAFYYALQCLVAVLVAVRTDAIARRRGRITAFILIGILCLAVAVFGISAG
jgi:hypothetical protein